MIFTVRTTVGQESMVVDILSEKIKQEELSVYSFAVLPGLKGYVLIEADNEMTVRRALSNVPHIKGKGIVGTSFLKSRKINEEEEVVGGEVRVVKIEELSSLLESKPLMKSIKVGQKVELIAGPFKGEKARVLRVNDPKEEVTVELLEATVKIPVTISAEHIRIIKE
ncbi:MAG: transcription elongation factor Spt5 [Candidatus Diapherotrites archaeon]|uniref:Transcription elongation factor Spt5 n=1 Tax=Candidatus Iainarchaeum sp. TaxID=3101447 RepID=A0A7J4KY17_9ARCH|nr:transcription elongation factor Spt5 [Candidatus Diapherotrites archaeon]HIH21473.1 transcription elongation factor Spt5 [Candidatus Diapherotrites archaeon]HIH33197.1 transcription elongation factor Spt5 [Candidatus Diapherotrites archaeon]